jgi:outer membrane protein
LTPEPSETVDRDALVATALARNPTVRQAQRRVAAAAAAVSAARSAYLPRISLSGRYSGYGSLETALQPEWNAGLQLSYPLFTGGARTRAVEEARAQTVVAEEEARLTEREVADAVDAAVVALRSAWARVAALEAAVSQSVEVARIEALALEAGAGVQTDYLEAEADLLEARAGLAEARHGAVEARVRLAQATGELSPEWLARITEVER